MRRFPLLPLAFAALLPACSPADDPGDAPNNAVGSSIENRAAADTISDPVANAAAAEPAAETEKAAGAAPAGATIGGDGSEITLSALAPADIDGARLQGELACSFSGGDATLLLAKGDVGSREPAFGIVKVGDYVETVSAPGGFDAMLKGGTFSGKGKTIRIAITGRATGGGESPPAPATLTYQRADGAERVFPGEWTCGP